MIAGIAALTVASFVTLDLQWAKFFSPIPRAAHGQASRRVAVAFDRRRFLAKLVVAVSRRWRCRHSARCWRPSSACCWRCRRAAPTPATARWRARPTRLVLNVLRSIPELVWAALLLISAGLGPFAGTLALAMHTTGVLGGCSPRRSRTRPRAGLRAARAGSARGRVFLYATLPQMLPQLLSYTLYRWENNIRAAAVLGVVGAGGLGQMLAFHMGLFQMSETSSVLIAMILLVAMVDFSSYLMRRVLSR
jgi:phosphonate transport system permease protein